MTVRRMSSAIRAAELDERTSTTIVGHRRRDDARTSPTSVDEMRWSTATYPGTARFLAELDGAPGRCATRRPDLRLPARVRRRSGRPSRSSPTPAARASGSAARRPSRSGALAAGKTALHMPVVGRPAGGDRVPRPGAASASTSASKIVRLELAGLAPPAVELPGRHLADDARRAARPRRRRPRRRRRGLRRHPRRRRADGGRRPRGVPRPRRRPADDPARRLLRRGRGRDRRQVVGYASLLFLPGQTRRRIAWHDMTAVARDWRGRGLAPARSSARRSAGRSPTASRSLETGNDTDNLADARGQCPARLPARCRISLTMRGPLFGGIMDR